MKEGHYKIRFEVQLKEGGAMRYIERVLGMWWLWGAGEGCVEEIPVINF